MAPETMATEVLELFNMDSYVNVELDTEDSEAMVEEEEEALVEAAQVLFTSDDRRDAGEEDDEDDDSGTDYLNVETPGTRLLRAERDVGSNSSLPDVFQTNNLLFYERFKAYQDYMLGDCKTSEVWAFISEYLEKVVEPCDWQALWSTQVFDILVEVEDVDYKELKASVKLALPLQFEARGCELNEESMRVLLDATQHKVALQELQVVYDESGEFDQTALAIEHLRFFCKHIWRKWDEEDEDDEFDYFVRSLEPRLRLYYDILEDRVPTGLVAEYHSLLSRCSQRFHQFSSLRNDLNSDSESELDNVSMVEGLRLYEEMETLRRKLRIIENPLIRYVLGYQGSNRQQFVQTRGTRASGGRVVHVVTASTTAGQLLCLLHDRLQPLCSDEHTEIQFHSDPVLAIGACYQGDAVIILPGHYCVSSSIFLPDSITIEGFGLSDEVVIEKKNKGDSFVESMGADVKISNIKFIEHDAIEGILCVRQGRLEMENCVLQCDTTGVIVRSSAQLSMNMCDIYGSKGAGVEVYPGSVCSLIGNGIHHCKEGILIKDFADVLDVMPRITMENNVIHNNEGYGVILVKRNGAAEEAKPATQDMFQAARTGEESSTTAAPAENPPAAAAVATEACPSKTLSFTLTSSDHTTTTTSSISAGCSSSALELPSGSTEGRRVAAVVVAAAATSSRKLQLVRQLSRNKEPVSTQADEGLMERQEMFVSIKGNEFKRNGLANFGTFLY